MKQFLEKFSIESTNPNLPGYYEGAKALFAEKGSDILRFEKHSVYTYMKEDIARVRDLIAADDDSILYAYMMYLAMKADDNDAITALARPNRHLAQEKYDLLPLFPMLYCIPDQVRTLRKKGVPEDVIADTLNMYEAQVQDFVNIHDHYGICEYVDWMMRFVRCDIIRVGRFNLEICPYEDEFDIFENNGKIAVLPKGVTFHRSGQILGNAGCEDTEGSFTAELVETDAYYEGCLIEDCVAKNERVRLDKRHWKRYITTGDTVICVHIPDGEPLTPETCFRDLARGRKIIHECFCETKALFTYTWLLSPQLRDIIGRESNLTAFGKMFHRFPAASDGSAPFDYVFRCPKDTPLELVPVKNRFAGAVKDFMLKGGFIWETQGIILDIPNEEA
ncbi:MAG: DUF5596 domain-containing protein [Clostridia bacterium]|nr:DUF5596 domain-containing protein [Clostridia bacterium]